jgi:hypothetical protein
MENFDRSLLEVAVVSGIAPTGEREPVEMVLGRRRVAVQSILDRWFGAGYRYFKLLGDDGAIYIVRHEEARNVWEITFFKRVSPAVQGPMQLAGS